MKSLLLLAVLPFILVGQACMPQAIEDHERYIGEEVRPHPELRGHFIESEALTLYYVESLPAEDAVIEASRRAIVFIHGSPGDWGFAGRYLLDPQLRAQARVVSIDRPGWGLSGSEDQSLWPEFSDQAAGIFHVVAALKAQDVDTILLVGHSLGASILPQVLADYPDAAAGAVLIAGSYDPERGKPRWYNSLASTRLVQWMLPAGLSRSNKEIMALRNNLQNLAPRWSALAQPITVMQGMKDKLVYPDNIDFAESKLGADNAVFIRYPDLGHLIPFEQPELVVAAVLELLDRAVTQ